MIDLIALSAAKKHADLLAMGLTSVSVDNTNKSITFTFAADGSQRTIYFDQPSDGVSIIGVEIKNGHLICSMSDGSEIDAGVLPSGGSGGSVPKPLTYDYMPEGYPSKSVQTVTLMEEQEVAFASVGSGYEAQLPEALAITEGQTYTVNWDGTEYECVCSVLNSTPILGNLSIMNEGDDTGEPFIYISVERMFGTLDTSASHTISIKTVTEVITPMAYDYMPEGYPKKRRCNIEWDGNTEGLISVLEMLYKVSDLLPTDDELIGSTIELSNRKKAEITSAYIQAVSEDITFVGENDTLIAVVKKDNAIFEDTTFPQKGTYFAKQQNIKVSKPNSLYVKKLTGTITPMAEEFIPTRIVEAIHAADAVASNAQATADTAKTAASNAQTAASNAQTTASNAQTTANTAKTAANTAKETANAAKAAADNAQATATNAQSTANAAKTTADNAQATASNAQATADTAKTAANTAKETANAAKTAAENAVKYTASQNLTDAQKEQARTNIGAGTSSFSGSWNDLTGKPLVPTDDHINELINTALSAIGIAEEGAY